MSRKDRRAPRLERIRGLVEAGDHGAARAAAAAVLADATSEEERTGASEILASLAPDRGVVAAGAAGVAAAIAIALLVLGRG